MNIRDILDEHNVPYMEHGEHHHTTEGWLQVDCPFCSPNSESYKLGINETFGYCSCWSCGSKGISWVISNLCHLSYTDARNLANSLERMPIPEQEAHTGRLNLPVSNDLRDCMAHCDYLRSRGFSPKKLQELWGVSGTTHDLKFPWSLLIPIHYRGKVVSFTTRRIETGYGPRYKAAAPHEEAILHKTLLYGEDYVRHAICIVEGPTDVWRIGPGAVCTFGTAFTEEQVSKIIKYPMKYVCYDSEHQAQEQARKLLSELRCFPGKTVNIRLDAKDPGSASKKEIQQLRRAVFGE